MIYIMMGVSGSGKTLIGKRLAKQLHLPFFDADDYHSAANILKMKNGRPLNDEDRQLWLRKLRRYILGWDNKEGAVLAFSALKKSYRKMISSGSPSIQFIYLRGDKKVIKSRLKNRTDHYFPASLLNSQFTALEEPEDAIIVGIAQSPDQIVQEILKRIGEPK